MDLQILLYLMTVLGTAGAIGMLAVHLTYRRTLRKTKATTNLRENGWICGRHEINSWIGWISWYGFHHCYLLYVWECRFFISRIRDSRGLPMSYLYIGTAVPIVLLVLRQALDFSFKEELVMNSLADYILQARSCKKTHRPPVNTNRCRQYRKQIRYSKRKWWSGLLQVSDRLRRQEVISARCWVRRRKKSWEKSSGSLWNNQDISCRVGKDLLYFRCKSGHCGNRK